MKRLVLVGGGHAHVEVLLDLAQRPDPRWDVTLVTPQPQLIYTGMVPGVIAGHYRLDECAIDLASLAERAGAAFARTQSSLVSPGEREVACVDGSALAYDVLSIDVGSRPPVGAAQGVAGHAIAVRPLEALLRGWGEVLARARDGKVRSITVVGAGAAGVELALSMDYRLRRDLGGDAPHVRVMSNTPDLLEEFAPGARKRLKRRLAARNIGAHVSSAVVEVAAGHVRTHNGHEFASDATFWAAGAGAHDWIADSGFATDERGCMLVNDYLQSVTFREVFGAGDCVSQEGRPHAKAGVFAVRAAPALAANLRAALAGEPLVPHVTTPTYLALVAAGDRRAVGIWNGWSWEGRWAWRWKDRIDRRFIARYAPAARGPGNR
jgi:selenide,water dikinase